jgi:hypothetical protein
LTGPLLVARLKVRDDEQPLVNHHHPIREGLDISGDLCQLWELTFFLAQISAIRPDLRQLWQNVHIEGKKKGI